MKKLDLSNYNCKQLKIYLRNHPDLPDEEVFRIKTFMIELLEKGLEMMDKWMGSPMFELSALQLRRKGRATIHKNKIQWSVDELLALIEANNIVATAKKNGIDLNL